MNGVKIRTWFAIFDGEEQLTRWDLRKDKTLSKVRNLARQRRPGLVLKSKRFIEPANA